MFGIFIVPSRRCELTFRYRLTSQNTWVSRKINLELQISQDLPLRVISVSQRWEFWTRHKKKCRNLHFGVGMVAVSRIFILFHSRNTLKNHCSTRVPIRRMCATTKYTGLVSDTSETNRNVTIANTSTKLLWSILHIPDTFNVEILI
jgi:hypothetical protein